MYRYVGYEKAREHRLYVEEGEPEVSICQFCHVPLYVPPDDQSDDVVPGGSLALEHTLCRSHRLPKSSPSPPPLA